MHFHRHLITIVVFSLLCACASHEPGVKKEKSETEAYPAHLNKSRSFYLIGDVGHNTPEENNKTLGALESFLDSKDTSEDFLLFLGDNAPSPFFSGGKQERNTAKELLNEQIDAAQDFEGKVVFLPGELDWDDQGMSALEAQEEYLEETLDNDVFMPRAGCPLQFVDISDDVHLIIMDSQWFLNNWDDHPTINDDCPEIKTREAMFVEIETELKKNQNKTTVFALHHPLYSNGVHGGSFYVDSHLQPSVKENYLPVLGPLAMFLRTTGGLSPQDLLNVKYRDMIDRVETIAKKWGKVVFVSGHDHSLQYIEEEHIKQIISGSGALGTVAGLGDNGLFSYSGKGFAVFDVFEDGTSWVSFYGVEGNDYNLLYQKKV